MTTTLRLLQKMNQRANYPIIQADIGVVIATEKKLPSILIDEASVQKIQLLTSNIGVVYSGMGPDSRVLVRKSRKQAEQYYKLYKERIPVTQLVRETAAVMQEFTQSGFEREDAAYQVYEDQSVSEALSVLSEKRVVVVAVVHRNNRELVGSVRYTDISLLLDNDNRIKSAANWMSCKQWDCHLFVID